jgi:hypothetical protein
MKKDKPPKDIGQVKNAFDACFLIQALTKSYDKPSVCPEDDFIFRLRQIAMRGMEKQNEELARLLVEAVK